MLSRQVGVSLPMTRRLLSAVGWKSQQAHLPPLMMLAGRFRIGLGAVKVLVMGSWRVGAE